MKPGDIVLARLPQSDSEDKLRPALLVCQFPPFGDWLVCGISSQLRQLQPGFDELLDASAEDFAETGLRMSSIIRLGYLSTLSPRVIGGVLGRVPRERLRVLLGRLSAHFAAAAAAASP